MAGSPPRAEWYGLLGNPLTQISLYGIHPVRGGVTDGKRSRLQPSAAGSARDGTRRDATGRGGPSPPPRAARPRRGPRCTNVTPAGAVPPQATPSPGVGRAATPQLDGAPAQPRRGGRCCKGGGKAGPTAGPRCGPGGLACTLHCEQNFVPGPERVLGTGTQRALPAESLTYPLCCGEEGVLLIWRCLLICYTCRVIVKSGGSGTGCWEALPGKPGRPQPSRKVRRTWEQCSGILGCTPRAQARGHQETTIKERGVRLVLSSSLDFVLILVAVKPGDTHPRWGCQAAPGSGQAKLGARPQTRLAREPRDRGYR